MTSAQIESIKALAHASGITTWNWDQWNWFADKAEGIPSVNPEDRGYERDASGNVNINGASTYPFETWFEAAHGGFGVSGAGSGTSGSGAGGGASTGAPGPVAGLSWFEQNRKLVMIAAGVLLFVLIAKGGE